METERINRIRRFGADMVCGADRKGSVSQGSVTIKEQIRLLFTGGASSCPAPPNKKLRAFARCGKQDENSLTSKLDACFHPVFHAP